MHICVDQVPPRVHEVGHKIEDIEGTVQGEGHHGGRDAVLRPLSRPAAGDASGGAVERPVHRGGGVINAKPKQSGHLPGHVRSRLAHNAPPSGPLSDVSLVEERLPGVVGSSPLQRGLAVGVGVLSRSDIREHLSSGVESSAFVVISHGLHDVLRAESSRWLDEQRHAVGEVVALRVVEVLVGPGFAHDRAKERPNSSLAKPRPFKGHRVVSIRKRKVGIFSRVQPNASSEGDGVGSIQAVVLVIEGEGGDSSLIGMASDVAIRNATSHPHSAFLVTPLSNQLHHPELVLVSDGKALPG